LRRMHVFVIAWLVAAGVIYLFGQADRTFLTFASNIISPASALLPASYGLALLGRYTPNLKDRFARIWLCLTVGLWLWLLGEITWSIYTLVLSVSIPYPSAADLFWIAGYVPLAAAMFLYLLPYGEALSLKKAVIVTAVGLLADVGIFAVLVGPILSLGVDPLEQFFDLAYPVLDLALLGIAISGLLIFLPGKISRFWLWLNLGFICMAIADLLFSYLSALDLYYDGSPLELFYFLGDAAMLLALYHHKEVLEGR